MINLRTVLLITLIVVSVNTQAQQEIKLYKSAVPNSKEAVDIKENNVKSNDGFSRVSLVSEPVIYAYFPEKKINTGKAIIICPGGGYGILSIDKEGHDVAKRLAAEGIAAFVLKYRLPNDALMIQKDIGPLQDAQRAIQLVRENAKKWKIKSNQIGIAGFSAGGHLASTLGTHYQKAYIDNSRNTSLRPDFMLLMYPVISMKSGLTHKGSQVNLLGNQPSDDQITLFSNEEQITSDTPPAFLVHAEDDATVPIANSQLFHSALEKHHIPTKLLVYPNGGHGFGLNNRTTKDQWFDHFVDWLNSSSF
jgi:acetyl esterase/lipase